MKKLIFWSVLLCALLGAGIWVRHKSAGKGVPDRKAAGAMESKPAAPKTVMVAPHDISFSVTAAGEIGPLDSVSVRPEIGGLISKLPLDIGDKVKKGEVLFELNDKDLQTEKTSVKIEISGATLAVQTQTILLEKSKLGFERTKSLFDQKLVSHEIFDNARLDYELARNNLAVASNRLETAQTALQIVEDKLIKTVIRAPFDCTILSRPISVGQAVSGASGYNSGTEVYSVANLADMIIAAHINQSDVTRVKVGQEVTVQVEAVPGLKLVGHVDRIAPLATIKNGVKGFSTRVSLKNAEELVRPGMTANLTIPLVSAGNVLAVPLAAVFTDKGQRFAYVKTKDDNYERRPIELGVADFDFAEVTKGLSAGDVVSLINPPIEAGLAGQQPAAKTGPAPAQTSAGKTLGPSQAPAGSAKSGTPKQP